MEQPIFILSSARSGSTLLRYVLDTHPEVYAPPELSLGALARSLAITLGGLHGLVPARPPFGADSPEVLALVADHVAGLMGEHTRRRGKSIWCEKSPQNLDHLDLLTTLFPEARYLCLYRNHMDTVDSCLDWSRYLLLPALLDHVRQNPRVPIRSTVDYWIDSTAQLLAFERAGRCRTYRVRYEDLVRRPRETLAPLFSFLGLAWDPALVDDVYRTPHDGGLADFNAPFVHQIHTDSVGRGGRLPQELATDEQRARIAELNRELDYGEILREIAAQVLPPPPPAPGARERPPAADGRGARWVFEEVLPPRLASRGEELAPLHSSYRFAVSGEGGGSWTLHRDAEGALAVLGEGGHDVAAPTVFGIGETDLLGLVDGRLHVVQLEREGRLTFGGARLNLAQVHALIALFRPGA